MTHLLARSLPVAVTALILLLAAAGPVAAHTGEGVSMQHVIVEVGTWTLAVAGVIAAIVAVFWVRARVSRR